jgi:hypothetical protein
VIASKHHASRTPAAEATHHIFKLPHIRGKTDSSAMDKVAAVEEPYSLEQELIALNVVPSAGSTVRQPFAQRKDLRAAPNLSWAAGGAARINGQRTGVRTCSQDDYGTRTIGHRIKMVRAKRSRGHLLQPHRRRGCLSCLRTQDGKFEKLLHRFLPPRHARVEQRCNSHRHATAFENLLNLGGQLESYGCIIFKVKPGRI